MSTQTRLTVARQLEPFGLRQVLVAVERPKVYDVSRIRSLGDPVDLQTLFSVAADEVPVIGRVTLPDPESGLPFRNSMPFYGRWFDRIGRHDTAFALRRKLAGQSPQMMIDQLRRDDDYAIAGSYYCEFRAIMAAKQRPPLVLIDDAFLALRSFPVVLPRLTDRIVADNLIGVLNLLLRPR
jgi:hypothetical protein